MNIHLDTDLDTDLDTHLDTDLATHIDTHLDTHLDTDRVWEAQAARVTRAAKTHYAYGCRCYCRNNYVPRDSIRPKQSMATSIPRPILRRYFVETNNKHGAIIHEVRANLMLSSNVKTDWSITQVRIQKSQNENAFVNLLVAYATNSYSIRLVH